MVNIIAESHSSEGNELKISFDYNEEDSKIIDKIYELIKNQPACWNCIHYKDAGNLCGYNAHNCDIYGNIEAFDNPHYDSDGSKCNDYARIK